MHDSFVEEEEIIVVSGVARAYFEAQVARAMAVELAEDDGGGKGFRVCECLVLLQKSLFGTRDAAENFQKGVQIMYVQVFNVGCYNLITYIHTCTRIRMMVHGDDFISTGSRIH